MAETDKPLLRALSGAAVTPAPIWLMRQAGRYLPEYRTLRAQAGSFLDLCYTPELAVEATLQPLRRFALDGAIIFSDILLIPHALGRTLRFEEGRGPVLEPLTRMAEVEALVHAGMAERLAPVYAAIAGVRAALPAAVALIGFAGAPWTIASYVIEGGTSRDLVRARRIVYEEPALLDGLIEALTDAVTEHLLGQIRAGAEAVQIFDSWAGVLPREALVRLSVAPIRRIAAALRAAAPDVPVIVFPRGVGTGYMLYAAEPGISAVSIDHTVEPGWAAAMLQGEAAVQGNLDPVALVAGGPAMDRSVDLILEALGGGPFVFNLGHGVLPETPLENVARLVERVRGYGAR